MSSKYLTIHNEEGRTILRMIQEEAILLTDEEILEKIKALKSITEKYEKVSRFFLKKIGKTEEEIEKLLSNF